MTTYTAPSNANSFVEGVAATITVNNVAYKFNVEPAIVPIGPGLYTLSVATEATDDNPMTVTGSCDQEGGADYRRSIYY